MEGSQQLGKYDYYKDDKCHLTRRRTIRNPNLAPIGL
jgi:hypothetical protein